MGNHYILNYHTPEEVMKFLDSIPVELVVIDNESGLFGTPSYYSLFVEATAYLRFVGPGRDSTHRRLSRPND